MREDFFVGLRKGCSLFEYVPYCVAIVVFGLVEERSGVQILEFGR